MSFSFSAGGTKAETLSSLQKPDLMSLEGQVVKNLVTGFLVDAAEQGGDGSGIRYEVNAYGHHSPGSLPSLSVSVKGTYVKPEGG